VVAQPIGAEEHNNGRAVAISKWHFIAVQWPEALQILWMFPEGRKHSKILGTTQFYHKLG
jgi:hypothetical protein